MSRLVGSREAADVLGVTPATLYAYVSRGRIERHRATDGRRSLFDLADVEALAARSRRAPRGPRPSIDVRIDSDITVIDVDDVSVRGHSLPSLVDRSGFEGVAELLWSGAVTERGDVTWPDSDPADRRVAAAVRSLHADDVSRITILAHLLDTGSGARHDVRPEPADVRADALRLLVAIPHLLGARRVRGRYAHRLASAWIRRPSTQMIDAVDVALGLLADHELATSTLSVRVAASVRATPLAAIGSGLATVSGPLHGGAAADAHRFLDAGAADGVRATVAAYRSERRRLPGFGHSVYRGADPRFAALRRTLDGCDVLDDVVAEVGRVTTLHPNVDLAVGALTRRWGLEPTTPIFAIARIAGWAAHYCEELDARPVRFRGVTR